jgi:hypothetical protein
MTVIADAQKVGQRASRFYVEDSSCPARNLYQPPQHQLSNNGIKIRKDVEHRAL